MHVAPVHVPVRRCPPHVAVAFTGRSGSGKSTIAKAVKIIVERDRHMPVKLDFFARPLKEDMILLGFEPGSPSWRSAAQRLGDEKRAADPDYYVKLLRFRMAAHADMPAVWLVDDMRFSNEGQVADLVFRLTTERPTTLTTEQVNHNSEQEWRYVYATDTFTNDRPEDICAIAHVCADKIMAFAEASRGDYE